MSIVKSAGLALVTVAALGVTVPASAGHRKPHQVCKIQRVHGHAHKVCHWVR